MSTPEVDLILRDPERKMTGSVRSVEPETPWGQVRVGSRLRVEEQNHLAAAAEEDVPPFQLRVEGQAKDLRVEVLGRVQVVNVETGLENEVEFSQRSRARHQPALSSSMRQRISRS